MIDLGSGKIVEVLSDHTQKLTWACRGQGVPQASSFRDGDAVDVAGGIGT